MNTPSLYINGVDMKMVINAEEVIVKDEDGLYGFSWSDVLKGSEDTVENRAQRVRRILSNYSE